MKHIVTFSGGKDSLAALLWVKNNIDNEFEIVFCDTGWESELTMKHIEDVERKIKQPIIRLKSEFSFESLMKKKGIVSSTKARFCTEWLKVRPMIDYILSHSEDLCIYQGIRSEESRARRKMSKDDEYFKQYTNGDKSRTYRKEDVLSYIENHSVDVHRPIFDWTADKVFSYINENGFDPNPLYFMGFKRVGCFPCVMCRHSEIKQILIHAPERIDLIRKLEKDLGRSFFPPNYIPKWACTGRDEKGNIFPFIDDVTNYLHNPNQKELFQPPSCQSHYMICE